MKALLVAGMPGAGKEEFTRVAEAQGCRVLRMGDVVRQCARAAGVPEDDESVGGFANSERESHGPAIWAVRTLAEMEDRVVIEGVRSMAELGAFRAAFGSDVALVAVVAGLRHRYERLLRRNRQDAPGSFDAFLSRDQREFGWGLGAVLASADLYLVNDGGIEDFRKEAASLLERIFGTDQR